MEFQNSNNPNKRFEELAAKLAEGSISSQEEKELFDWYNEDLNNKVFIPADFAANEDELRSRIFDGIQKKIKAEEKVSGLNLSYVRAVAAALILVVGFSVLYYSIFSRDEQVAQRTSFNSKKPALIAENKAVLTLVDGTEINLDDAPTGVLAAIGSSKFVKTANGQLNYIVSPEGERIQSKGYNSIQTPKGGNYQVTLADGSKVWLNSSSKLRFPAEFNANKREVELIGEAYFEVTKSKVKSFKIKVEDIGVTVLGTHFNIMAYKEEEEVLTTLLEGAVKVTNRNSGIILKPGEQGQIHKVNNQFKIKKNVDIEKVLAWKKGEFRFENQMVESVMRQLSRWFNIVVEYKKPFPVIKLSGSISKQNNLQQLLEILEATHRVNFIQVGNKVIVKPTGH